MGKNEQPLLPFAPLVTGYLSVPFPHTEDSPPTPRETTESHLISAAGLKPRVSAWYEAVRTWFFSSWKAMKEQSSPPLPTSQMLHRRHNTNVYLKKKNEKHKQPLVHNSSEIPPSRDGRAGLSSQGSVLLATPWFCSLESPCPFSSVAPGFAVLGVL